MNDVLNLPEEGRPFSFSLLSEVQWMKNGLSTYVELACEVEQMLDQTMQRLAEQLREDLRHLPAEEHQDAYETHGLHVRDYEGTFRYLQREAMFLALYNYFEHSIGKLCDWIGEEIKSRVRLKDIEGRGIERALRFLALIPQFSFSAIPTTMSTIRGANQLRNTIVHASAILPSDVHLAVNHFVRDNADLSGEPGRPVALHPDFVGRFAESLHQFFVALEAEMQHYMDRTWRRTMAGEHHG